MASQLHSLRRFSGTATIGLKMIYATLSGTQSIFLNIRKYLLKLVFVIMQYGT